jgi:uroporphyrinogen decarboxylase
MTHRERIRAIIAGEPADRCGFWLGHPHAELWPLLHKHFGTSTEAELRLLLQDDLVLRSAEYQGACYNGPEAAIFFDILNPPTKPPLADCSDLAELNDFPWPTADKFSVAPAIASLRMAGDIYRCGGMWCPFFHVLVSLFGMESYLAKMWEQPELIRAATDRVCQFYYDANEKVFAATGDLMDGVFFGNDLGTQADLICSPAHFDEFMLPWIRQFAAQGHRYGYQVLFHSCGSIHKVIERLIDAGIDCLHPLQARAAGMDAEALAREFKGRVAFMGGVDAQEMMPRASAAEIRAEVLRLKRVLGSRWIVSPSHETLQRDVPPANVQALAESARE